MAQHRTTEQQLAAAEERLNKLRKRQRNKDTRRRVLIGALYLGRAERDSDAHHRLMRDLDLWLVNQRDRTLFGLCSLRGLYGATPQSKNRTAGWTLGAKLQQAPRDRIGGNA